MITLTSDFGLKDPYMAEMKGVILTINPKATLVDITHEIEKFNIRSAAYKLASAAPYFPEGTVHLAVVDPGVGTQRRAIAIKAKNGFFVGPDNGVLILAAKNQGIEHINQLANPNFMLLNVSGTFHGRDIFAPAAAYLDKGVRIAEFGPEIIDPVTPKYAQVEFNGGSFSGEVLNVDDFGNIITNIAEKDVTFKEGDTIQVELADTPLKIQLGKAYAQAKPKEPILLVGSHGFLEIALNQDRAAKKLHVKAGDRVAFTEI